MRSVLNALAQGATVVTANNRLARHLRWQFDRRQQRDAQTSWSSPEIVPWNAWLDNLWEQSLLTGGTAGQYDLLGHEQSRLLWRNVVANDETGTLALNWPSAINSVIQAWQISCDWKISTAQLRKSAFSPDTVAFAGWASRYESLCREYQAFDRWAMPELIVKDLQSGVLKLPRHGICFSGFDRLTPQQLSLQRSVEAAGLLVREDAEPGDLSKMFRVRCDDFNDELQLAARWSRKLLATEANDVVGVLVPDPGRHAKRVRRTFLDIMTPDWRSRPTADLPVTLGAGTSLADVGLIHIALLILKVPDGRMDYRDFGQLLRTPYLKAAETEASARASLDCWIRNRQQMELDLRGIKSHTESAAPVFFDLLREGLDFRRDTGGGLQDTSRWAEAFASLLKTTGWGLGRALGSDEQQANDAWQQLLETFATCSPMAGRISFADARHLLTGMARERQFQPEGRADGIQIMGLTEAIGHRFDGLWICGLSSDVWPPSTHPNPLIPLDIQHRLKIPEAIPALTRDVAHQTIKRLAGGASVAYVSWPNRHEDEELVFSPMLEPLRAVDASSLDCHSQDTYRQEIFNIRQLKVIENDQPPPLADDAPARGGSGLLKYQAACPARAFFEYRLGASDLRIPPNGIDARLRGTITHDALDRLFQNIAHRAGLNELDDAQIRHEIEQAVEQALSRYTPRHHPLMATLRDIERLRLHELLWELIEIDRLRPPFTIEETEYSRAIELGPLTLNLRLDRLDRLASGGRLVIDYKTSAKFSATTWQGRRPAEPQLPLYAAIEDIEAIAVVLLNENGVKRVGVGVSDLAIDGLKAVGEFSRDELQDWPGLVRRWRRDLEQLAIEFAGGDCRIDPDNREFAEKAFAMLTRVHDKQRTVEL